MANSTHSIPFRRLFDTVVSNVVQPLKDRLWETYQGQGEKPEPLRQISEDVLHLAATLEYVKGGLTWEQYAFLGDLYDRIIRRDLGAAVDEHTNRFKSLAKDQSYWEPPIVSLNLLRGYDAVSGNKTAVMYKDLLLKIVSVTLTHIEKYGVRENQIIEEFDLFWTEIITATRAPQKRLHPDSSALIAEINKAVSEFVVPAREVIKSIDQLTQMPGLKDTEGFIRRTFTNYCAQAVLVDSVVDQRELELFHDLAPSIMFFGKQGSLENLTEIFKTASKNIGPNETPLLVSILDVYDSSMRTEFGNRARSLYFRLANTAFKADLTVSEEELEWLQQFKQTLYPNEAGEQTDNSSTTGSVLVEKQAGEVMPDVTVEQSLEELSLMIGLATVKQELSQLVNLIKVQQMRQEKGMPVVGSAIPKHLVFYGKLGTGKTSVAQIVGNIYRALGILKKGHVVEVDRADLVADHLKPATMKIQEVVASAAGGVLFVEEASQLIRDDGQDPHGQEAIDALVKALEDQSENLVVIMSGHQDKMERFIETNSGLKSLFKKSFRFEDYTPDQMLQIYDHFCSRAAFQSTGTALELVRSLFEKLYAERGAGFGNARDVRSVFECIIGNQANRVISLPHVNEEILSTITEEDVEPVVASEKTETRQALRAINQ